MGCVELETERLRLRQWRESDLGPFHDFYRDPVTQALFGEDVTRQEVWRRIALLIGHFQLRGFGLWALEEKSTRTFVGYGGLWFPEGWGDIEIGYGIAPAHRGKGFATEAARCARDHGYRKCRIPRLVSYILPGNHSSIRVAEKLGATPEGTFIMKDRQHFIYAHTNTEMKE